MALTNFKYVATDQNNNQVVGSFKAESREQVAEYLQSKGLFVVSISQDIGVSLNSLSDIQIGGVPLKEKMMIVKQLSTMLNAGLPVLQSIEILSKQIEQKKLKEQIEQVYAAVEGGAPLSTAFENNTELLNSVQVNLLAAGEKSGNMNEVIAKIAEDMEKSHELKSKIKSAMIYPAIIFVAIFIVLVILVVFMVPTVKSLYADFNAEDKIPGITLFLISLSDFFMNPVGLIALILVVVIGIVSYKSFTKTESGRLAVAKLQLKLPVSGNLLQKIQLTQFGRLLAMLLTSGVSIIDALTIVSKALSNPIYSNAVKDLTEKVAKGVPLAVPIAESGIFPLIYVRMIATGEQTGNLDKVLGDMAKFYQAEVDEITNNLTKLMEPLIMLIVGGLVGFLAVAVYLPIYNIGNVIT
jgi:type IV pilus assembly protein PilC